MESLNFYKIVVDNLPDIVFIKDSNHTIIDINQAFADFIGKDKESVIGTTGFESFPPEEVEIFLKQDLQAFEKGYSEIDENVTDKDGQVHIVRMRKTKITDATGNLYLLCRGTDITDWKREEEALKTIYITSSDSQLAIEQKVDKILKTGLDFFGLKIAIVSEICDDIYIVKQCFSQDIEGPEKLQEFELGNTYCSHVVQADDVCSFHNAGESEIADHPAYINFQLNSYIGVPLWVDGKRYGTVNFSAPEAKNEPFTQQEKIFVRMIGQWIGYELTRDQYIERLSKTNKELEQYSSIVSHDLKQPVRALKGFLELLQDGEQDKLGKKSQEYLQQAFEACNNMTSLIENLLSFASMGLDDSEKTKIDLNEMLNTLEAALPFFYPETDIQVKRQDLPFVIGNQTQLEQLFTNIMINAIKYSDKPTISIEISCEEKTEFYEITLKDNGPGIPDELNEIIFDPFIRGKSVNSIEGAGLGLSLCKKIVELHGGKIWIDKKAASGTIIAFTLPITKRTSKKKAA